MAGAMHVARGGNVRQLPVQQGVTVPVRVKRAFKYLVVFGPKASSCRRVYTLGAMTLVQVGGPSVVMRIGLGVLG